MIFYHFTPCSVIGYGMVAKYRIPTTPASGGEMLLKGAGGEGKSERPNLNLILIFQKFAALKSDYLLG